MPNPNSSRLNGARSQGPITPAGKAASSRNATRHGLTSSAVVLPGESAETFEALNQAFIDHFQPRTAVEAELVQTMAIARWRLRRLTSVETNLYTNRAIERKINLDRELPESTEDQRLAWLFKNLSDNSPVLPLLIRYESTLTRTFDRALKQLQKLRNEPKTFPEDTPQPTEDQ
jgi:hypothetical protein